MMWVVGIPEHPRKLSRVWLGPFASEADATLWLPAVRSEVSKTLARSMTVYETTQQPVIDGGLLGKRMLIETRPFVRVAIRRVKRGKRSAYWFDVTGKCCGYSVDNECLTFVPLTDDHDSPSL